MYELIETRDVSEIKVVDLIRKAGVSRGGFYKNYYLVTDVLKDDIKEVSDDVNKIIGKYIERDIGSNWEVGRRLSKESGCADHTNAFHCFSQ